MGSLSLPSGGLIYIDSNILIYTVERVAPYVQRLDPFWQGLAARGDFAITSELTALETLVGPMRSGDATLEALFRRILFRSPTLRLAPVTMDVLERAARLRADYSGLKTPDAIHAATALEVGARTFITNDLQFRQVPGLSVVTPRDLAAP
ncbi:MAG TPA: PIN domain-containing protein [Ktedonobacterales bacterium]|nr:PIN domain-containing protein [Ktedonobacterales bacterium]